MGERILEVERVSEDEVMVRFKMSKLRLLPPSTTEHVRTARRELLLAFRGLVDAALESLEQREGEGKGKGKERTKIEVN